MMTVLGMIFISQNRRTAAFLFDIYSFCCLLFILISSLIDCLINILMVKDLVLNQGTTTRSFNVFSK